MMTRDVLLILVTMALFLFALQPREHAHGGRRRQADSVTDVEAASVSKHCQSYEATALEGARICPTVTTQSIG